VDTRDQGNHGLALLTRLPGRPGCPQELLGSRHVSWGGPVHGGSREGHCRLPHGAMQGRQRHQTVELIQEKFGNGASIEQVLASHLRLTRDARFAVLQCAAHDRVT
jgi:hypothetical protein